jgi:two-component system LytT family sensor kinase
MTGFTSSAPACTSTATSHGRSGWLDRGSKTGLFVLAFWLIQGIVGIHSLQQAGVGTAHGFAMSMTSALLWVPLTWWAVVSSDRFPIEPGRWKNALVHMFSTLGVCAFRGVAVLLLNPWVRWETKLPSFGELMVTSFHKNFFFYVVLVGAAHALHYQRRSRERERAAERLEAALAQSQLSALKAQLHPHFLFNSLQSITELLHRDVEAADRMIVSLSRLLRQFLESESTQEVSLATEIRTLEPYIELQRLRFGDRLRVEIEVEPDALSSRVPHLVLQPLVENSIRHGIAPRERPGRIRIRARLREQTLELEVADDGVGLPEEVHEGLGLSNTRARLRQLYGSAQRFELRRGPGDGCIVSLHIPRAIAEAR